MNTKNMQRLGNILSDRMKATSGAAVKVIMELGTINGNLSLSTDSLQSTIPKGAYMVNLMLTGGSRTSSESHTHDGGTHDGHAEGDGSHSHSGGEHSHALPGSFRGLQAGDRVLVAWCGNEPVVVAVVVSS